jgi:hypothetical protein
MNSKTVHSTETWTEVARLIARLALGVFRPTTDTASSME